MAEVASINPRLGDRLKDDDVVAFLGMADVSENGSTTAGDRRLYSEVSKGYTPFRNEDLLVAKITPCFENGKIAQAEIGLDVGFGSTEFHVVRPDPSILDARYALHFLRSPRVRQSGQLRMTGSGGQRRVPRTFIEDLEISLPPLPEQRRIAGLLDAADSLKAQWVARINHLDVLEEALLKSLLSRTSGARRTVAFGDIVEDSQLGVVRSSADYGAVGQFGYLRMDAITRSGRMDLTLVQRTSATPDEVARAELRSGDLLFNTRNSKELVGKSAVYYGPSGNIFNNNILRVRFMSGVSPAYITAMLRTGEVKSQLESRKRGTTSVFAVYYRDLASIEIELPDTSEMTTFEENIRRIEAIRAKSVRAAAIVGELKTVMQAKTFQGEL